MAIADLAYNTARNMLVAAGSNTAAKSHPKHTGVPARRTVTARTFSEKRVTNSAAPMLDTLVFNPA